MHRRAIQTSMTIHCLRVKILKGNHGILRSGVVHTAYSRNNMGQKCEGNCGLWVLNEMIKKIYPGNLKKIVGAIWKLPAK